MFMILFHKGTAVLWFNLLRNGNEDARTLHAACPVFVGNKWGKCSVRLVLY